VGTVAKLLAQAGHTEEAILLLEEHDSYEKPAFLADYLIDVGRVEDAVALLQNFTPAPPPFTGNGAWNNPSEDAWRTV
jgi:hypothetical protein